MTAYLFFQPFDVLFFRGNEAFGDPGQHGEALMPPWPSVFSGALRSAILAANPRVQLGLFSELTRLDQIADARIREVIGTPREPGTFRVSFVALGTRSEVFVPAPADLLVWADGDGDAKRAREVRRLVPTSLERFNLGAKSKNGVPFSFPHELKYVLSARLPKEKPSSGWWLTQKGLEAYLGGEIPAAEDFVHSSRLWKLDDRLGIARSRESFTVETGRIYTSSGVALAPGIGFIVGVEGVDEELLQTVKVVRLGGDGRGAEVVPWEGKIPERPLANGEWLAVCLTPCVSPDGWKPPVPDGLSMVACTVPRPQVVSGWDLAAHQPKPAQAVIPPGSVFYFEGPAPQGQPFVVGLERWLQREQSPRPAKYIWRQRLAEGFNLTLSGVWPKNH
ncbi:MAG: hypothetical protein KatS3mg007_1508 [Thermoanaerobaculum sp.]|nr:MAG: hypothetical protein KatS3mg007_1508 [Thermoanaerobaculum sp.]